MNILEEIYNYKLLKQELEKKFDVNFLNETDTSVLLESISLLGLKKTLNLVEGMFAFSLFDKKDDKFYLSFFNSGPLQVRFKCKNWLGYPKD